MSTIIVDTIQPTVSGAYIDLNGTDIRESVNGNIGIGANTLPSVSGPNNIAIGDDALNALTTGDDNVAVGKQALISFTGTNSIAIGQLAGSTSTTGTNNVFIGRASLGSSATASDEITLGNSSHTVIRAAVTTITSLSDERDKKEIQTLPLGLEFVEKLKPVKFVWNDRDENGKHDVEDFGFIAQDLKSAQEESEASYLNLVYDENPDKLEASYGKLLPILVKAIQEMNTEMKSLKEEILTLKNK
jgi:hypothetical protein